MNEEKEQLTEDLKKYKAIDALAISEGGKILIESLKKDILSAVDILITGYKDTPEIELRAIISKMGANLELLRVLTRADKNKKIIQEQLKEMLDDDSRY